MTRVVASQLTDDWTSVLRFLTGEKVPTSIERKAVSAIKRDVEGAEREDARRQREWARVSQRSRAPLREALATEEQVAATKKLLHPLLEQWRAVEPVENPVEPEEASVSLGSITTTVVPPYDFTWTYVDEGGPATVTTTSRKSDGFLLADVSCPEDGDGSHGVAFSAVGIFFKSALDGVLEFKVSIPALIDFWYTACFCADARSRGAMGLKVFRFISGQQNPADGPYHQQDWELWYDDSWWGPGSGPHSDAFAKTLTLGGFPVSHSHSYNLWVYYRMNANADGGGLLYDSAARAEMNGFVPSMKMTVST